MAESHYLNDFTLRNSKGLLDGFQTHLLASDRGASVSTYLTAVKRFVEWTVAKYGNFNPASISTLDMVEYRSYLQGEEGRHSGRMAARTVNKNLVAVRVFFNWLKHTGVVRDNPADGVRQVAVEGGVSPRWLDRDQQRSLVHVVREGGSLRDMAIIGLMLHAGLRVREVCTLRREDVVISERKGVLRVTGKGNKVRQVPLNKTLRKILTNWLAINQEGPLFPNRFGQPITVDGVEKLFREYAYHAHLTGVTPHSLRHAFCKNLIDLGVPIDQVAVLAGHASLDVTKRYTAPSMADLQAAVEKASWE